MMTPYELVLSKLPDAKQTGDNFSARCPAHDDNRASLSVSQGDDGRVLLKCHAGCELDAICTAMHLTMRDLFPSNNGRVNRAKPKKEIVATYRYVDETGVHLFDVVRFEPKDFRQRAADGAWKIKGIRKVLYRLPELLAAPVDTPVYIAEGEKDVDNLRDCGCVATCNPGGAMKWRYVDDKALEGRNIIVVPDNDTPGMKHAQDVAKRLRGRAASIRFLIVPESHKDITDAIRAGIDIHSMQIVDSMASGPAADDDDDDGDDDNGKEPPKKGGGEQESLALKIVKLAHSRGCVPFHDTHRCGYVVLPVDGHLETVAIRSSTFTTYLAGLAYCDLDQAASAEALTTAKNALDAHAIFKGQEHRVYLRTAEHDGAWWVDLCDASWRAIRITETGWEIVERPPVRFRREPGMMALPEPERDGSVNELRDLLNVGSDDDFRLAVAWMLGALVPVGPYPNLALAGQKGSGKTTVSRMLRMLVDPTDFDSGTPPTNERDLAILCGNARVVSIDNLRSVEAWLSDALCRCSTGGSFRTRRLYSDDEETLIRLSNPVITTSIVDVVTAPDLLDRTIIIDCPVIPASKRRKERELNKTMARVHPRVFGALLDAIACGLKNRDRMPEVDLPRLADFVAFITAAESALGWPSGSFLAAYRKNVDAAQCSAVEFSPVAREVIRFANGLPLDTWSGTVRELFREVDAGVDESARKGFGWPKNAASFGKALRNVAPSVAAVSQWTVTIGPRHKDGRMVTLAKTPDSSVTTDTTNTNGDSDPASGVDSVSGAVSATNSLPTPTLGPENPVNDPENEGDDGSVRNDGNRDNFHEDFDGYDDVDPDHPDWGVIE